MTIDEFVDKWYHCHRPQPCRVEGVTTPAHERIHNEGRAAMRADLERMLQIKGPEVQGLTEELPW